MSAKKLFISYSQADTPFAEKLHAKLEGAGYEVFRDVGDAIAGPLDRQLAKRIQEIDALLLIFSENSAGSHWVEWEVQTALDRERKEGMALLCPIKLDDAWKTAPWRGPIMHQVRDYAILDFSDAAIFDEMFVRLHKGLQAFYG